VPHCLSNAALDAPPRKWRCHPCLAGTLTGEDQVASSEEFLSLVDVAGVKYAIVDYRRA